MQSTGCHTSLLLRCKKQFPAPTRTYNGVGDADGPSARVETIDFVLSKYHEVVHVSNTDVPNEGIKDVVHHGHDVVSGVRSILRLLGGLPPEAMLVSIFWEYTCTAGSARNLCKRR